MQLRKAFGVPGAGTGKIFSNAPTPNRLRKERRRQPLVLTGHGISLRIEGQTLKIRNGLTHYPQKPEITRYFPGDLNLPERIILVDGTGSLSFDVMSWLAQQGVALIRINYRGEIICLSAGHGYSADFSRVDWQRQTRHKPALRMQFGNALIVRKIENSIRTLEKAIRQSARWEQAMQIAYATLTRLEERPAQSADELRGLEGAAGRRIFSSVVRYSP